MARRPPVFYIFWREGEERRKDRKYTGRWRPPTRRSRRRANLRRYRSDKSALRRVMSLTSRGVGEDGEPGRDTLPASAIARPCHVGPIARGVGPRTRDFHARPRVPGHEACRTTTTTTTTQQQQQQQHDSGNGGEASYEHSAPGSNSYLIVEPRMTRSP